jgi:hypothetical protein
MTSRPQDVVEWGGWHGLSSSLFLRLHLQVAQVLRLARAERAASEGQNALAVGQAELVPGRQCREAEAAEPFSPTVRPNSLKINTTVLSNSWNTPSVPDLPASTRSRLA